MDISSIKACICDMDGTLLDSLPFWCRAERALFAQRGVTPPEGLDTQLFMFHDIAETLARLNLDREAAWAAMAALMDGDYADRIPAKQGAETFLGALRARGVRCYVATGSRRRHAEAALARCGLSRYFLALYSTHETLLKKEDPAFFPWIAGELGVAPGELLVIEDSPIVAKNAKAAGCTVFGILDDAYGDDRPLRAVCDRVGRDFTSLLAFP